MKQNPEPTHPTLPAPIVGQLDIWGNEVVAVPDVAVPDVVHLPLEVYTLAELREILTELQSREITTDEESDEITRVMSELHNRIVR